MNKRALTVFEIEALAPSTLISPDEWREPVSLDGGDYLSKPETRRSAALRWFIDTLALAGAAMAGSMSATGSIGRTSPASGQTEKTRPRRDSAVLQPLAMMQTEGRLIESFR
jgi:hypothetical protein